MPELPFPKIRPEVDLSRVQPSAIPYAELHVTTNFSFLRGASHPEEMVARAAEMGCHAVAITDINSLAGIVRGKMAAKDAGLPYIVGCHLQVKAAMGPLAAGVDDAAPPLSLLVYPTDRSAYGRLCRLLTYGKRRAPKGQCRLTLQDVLDHQAGLLAIVLPPPRVDEIEEHLRVLRGVFDDDRLSLAATCLYDGRDEARLSEAAALARRLDIPLVATNDVHYHVPERKPLQDVLTCIRVGCTIEQAGFSLFANAERHIKGPEEMARLFAAYPEAIARTMTIARRALGFSLDQLKYEYPSEVCPPGKSMMEHLRDLTWKGACERYPAGISDNVRRRIEHEFELIESLNYPAYFLTVADIVTYARSQGILCQGRGAAANSTVCYCLGVTAVDPERIDLLVERFISKERDEPPDIDIDFEHERREEVIQYLYQKYGRDRAALTAEVISYRRRSAIRDVGKAMGLSLDCVDKLAKSGDWWDQGVISLQRVRELGLDARDPILRQTFQLASELIGFPRHLSQHVGGFIITQGPLCESVPIENAAMPDRTVIEWDKDDIDELGMLKVDVLGLGMLTCIRKAIDLVNVERRMLCPHSTDPPLQFHTVPPEDPAVYDMLCRADSIGVFQVESRAQMTMLPRLKPRRFYDLVIEVAIVRPGPIQGGMVHPYLRRRNGEEEFRYPNPQIEAVLGKTLGVPLFQEQAMKLAIVAGGFTPGEADKLRRAMAAWKRKGNLIHLFGQKMIAGMLANGYDPEFAHRCFDQIKGFSDYGFPESHAASFALLVYVSAWLKCHHPAAFAAALINSQPMGFYQPAQIVRDAREHGVAIRPVDVSRSHWDCTLEPDGDSVALRLGMRLVASMRQAEADKIRAAFEMHGSFRGIQALWRASGVRAATLRTLASADAFASMGLDRQAALWAISRLRDDVLPMFDQLENSDIVEAAAALPEVSPIASVVYDYAATGLSLKAHPLSFSRPLLTRRGIIASARLSDPLECPHGRRVAVAGLVLVRQRPGTASGIVFMTTEDETGVANLVVRPQIYDRFYRELRHSATVVVWGKVERQGQVVHVLVQRAANLARLMQTVPARVAARDFH
ncbi:MAG TPA: error-prone DNA polymerase [Phycisphaerae bacterium]|nr:error-prone DNA polymerase [Phycisphaerae bacterium]